MFNFRVIAYKHDSSMYPIKDLAVIQISTTRAKIKIILKDNIGLTNVEVKGESFLKSLLTSYSKGDEINDIWQNPRPRYQWLLTPSPKLEALNSKNNMGRIRHGIHVIRCKNNRELHKQIV